MRSYVVSLIFTCACFTLQAQVTIITTIAGNGAGSYCCDGGPATNAEINNANQLCLDKFGNLYFTDDYNNRVRKITLPSGTITTIAGTGIGGYSGDDSLATNAKLFIPGAIFADTTGNIYIGDGLNHRIRKVTISTGIITTIAGIGIPGNTGDGGLATNAEIYSPAGLYVDQAGNIYISDIDNNNIRKVTPNGIISTIAGIGTLGYSGDGGIATNAQFSAPTKATLDNSGNIIIADGNNNVLREIGVETGIINTIAGNGTPGYSGDGGPAINALLNGPYGIFIDRQNNIFFAEYGNGTIRRIDGITKIITTVAGCGIAGYAGDGGPPDSAKLIPEDVTIDQYGVMYIADYENNRIRAVYNPKLAVPAIQSTLQNYNISPNPSDGNITLSQLVKDTDPVFAQIWNTSGVSIYKEQLLFTNGVDQLHVVNAVPGLYLLQLTDSKGRVFILKFVIQ
jgi:sugar lactone lactonase YvrE